MVWLGWGRSGRDLLLAQADGRGGARPRVIVSGWLGLVGGWVGGWGRGGEGSRKPARHEKWQHRKKGDDIETMRGRECGGRAIVANL